MTTQKQLEQLVRPLLEDDPSLLLHGRFLILTPIQDHVCSLLIDRSSTPEEFVVQVRPMFLARTGSIGPEGMVDTKFFWPYDRFWRVDEPEYPHNRRMQLKYALIPEIKRLHAFFRFRNYSKTYFADWSSGFLQQETLLSIAHGEFKGAAKWMAEDWRHEPRKLINAHIEGLGDRLAEQGDKISMEDKRALVAILHELESAAIHAMKLEKYWQSTPFPVEEQGLV